MLRSAPLIAIGLISSACNSLYGVSESGQLAAPLDLTCVLETLRAQPSVRRADIVELGTIRAELVMPDGLEHPTPQPTVTVEMRSDDGETEIDFSVPSIGVWTNPEYRIHLENVLRDLRDRVIEECSAGEATSPASNGRAI
jgi:hypothetical protein